MRKFPALVASVLLTSLLVGTQASAPAIASSQPVRSTIQGVITDADTGDPVPGACISLYRYATVPGFNRSHRLARACADSSGAYQFADVPVNVAQLAYLEAEGYGSQWYPANGDPVYALNFKAALIPVTTINIALHRATAGLALHVARQDGSPAPYVSVQLQVPGRTGYASILRTDVNGDAVRTDLPAGQYKIQVAGAGYVAQWYPGKSTVDAGELVTLTAGATLSMNEQFIAVDPMPALPATVTATGTVRKADGTPIAGATVAVLSVNSTQRFGSATTDVDGRYAVNTGNNPTGMISVSAPGFATAWNTDDPLPLGSSLLSVAHDVVLRPGSGIIRGRLTDSVPGPIPIPTSVTLTSVDNTWTYRIPDVGYDGTFEVPNVPAGDYTVLIQASGRINQWVPAATTVSGAVPVTVADGQVTTVDATLLPPGRVKVLVLDDATGLPVAGMTVQIFSSAYGWQSAVTDAQGNVELGEFWRSDTVSVYVRTGQDYFAPTVLTNTVGPGASLSVTVRLRPGAVLSVPVTGFDPSYNICMDLLSGGPNVTDTTFCELPKDGRVTVGPIEAGTYQAFLRPAAGAGEQWLADSGGSGEQRKASVLRLTAGAMLTAPVQHLGPAGSIAGKVSNTANDAAAGGCVAVSPTSYSCVETDGSYRIDGLGPYAWPLVFHGQVNNPTVWSGNATSRLDAQLIPVVPGQTATYNFVLPKIGWFDVKAPFITAFWQILAFDAQTGDYAGSYNDYSVGTGPVLLRYDVYNGTGWTSCWIWHQKAPGKIASGVFYPGTQTRPAQVTVAPGVNCRPEQPPLVLTNGANQQLNRMLSGVGSSQQRHVNVTTSMAKPAMAAPETVPAQTFNELVRNSFDAALQLAIGALP
jgi:Carboxypeptidase regulatory-like domain